MGSRSLPSVGAGESPAVGNRPLHARSSCRTDELVFGARFASMFDHDERAGLIGVDLTRIHDVVPAPLGRDGDP